MIRIDTILKHVKTRNENMTKYTKFEQMADEMFDDKVIPWIAASKSSNQKEKGKNKIVLYESSLFTPKGCDAQRVKNSILASNQHIRQKYILASLVSMQFVVDCKNQF